MSDADSTKIGMLARALAPQSNATGMQAPDGLDVYFTMKPVKQHPSRHSKFQIVVDWEQRPSY